MTTTDPAAIVERCRRHAEVLGVCDHPEYRDVGPQIGQCSTCGNVLADHLARAAADAIETLTRERNAAIFVASERRYECDHTRSALAWAVAYFSELRTVDERNWEPNGVSETGYSPLTDFAISVDRFLAEAEGRHGR